MELQLKPGRKVTVLSAKYANIENNCAIISTEEDGNILVTQPDAPAVWAALVQSITITPYDASGLLLDTLAEVRWQAEIGGIEVDGMPVPTDDRSKVLIAGACNQALMQDEPSFTRTFKINGVFVSVTNAQVLVIGDAIADHVQQCFDAEALVAQQITNGDITLPDDIAAAFDLAYETSSGAEVQ